MIFSTQFQYHVWSNQRILTAVHTIDRQQYRAEFDFARQQLNHMVIVAEMFQARLCGQAAVHKQTNSDLLPDLSQLAQRIAQSDIFYQDYVKSITESDFGNQILFQFADGQMGNLTIEEILFHLINHTTYHRGNIAHALHHADLCHPADTYTVFIHQAEPQRRHGRMPQQCPNPDTL